VSAGGVSAAYEFRAKQKLSKRPAVARTKFIALV
jgi:hypothetical protein